MSPSTMIQEGFANFGGVGRRFQVKGEVNGIMVVDDYGHHPAEIRATLAAARPAGPTAGSWWPSSRTATPGPRSCSTSSSPVSTMPTCWS